MSYQGNADAEAFAAAVAIVEAKRQWLTADQQTQAALHDEANRQRDRLYSLGYGWVAERLAAYGATYEQAALALDGIRADMLRDGMWSSHADPVTAAATGSGGGGGGGGSAGTTQPWYETAWGFRLIDWDFFRGLFGGQTAPAPATGSGEGPAGSTGSTGGSALRLAWDLWGWIKQHGPTLIKALLAVALLRQLAKVFQIRTKFRLGIGKP